MAAGKTEKPPRLADVAEAAGVSQGTASNVFNHPELVREEVRDRVRAAAQKIGYSGPDPRGRILRAGKVNAIGVATSEELSYFFDDPFARALMARIADLCDASGTGLSLVSAASEQVLDWNISSALVDGLILFCFNGTERLIARAQERDLPFVALALDNKERDLSLIDIDNFAGGRMAAEHLLALGHRNFAILALELTPKSVGRRTLADVDAATLLAGRDRVLGSFEALTAAGIDSERVPIFEASTDASDVHQALETLFAQNAPPTAIIAQSDLMAMIALDWFAEHGICVPDEVSIVGFDGVPESATTEPPLTTIAQPIDTIARHAVAALLERRDGRVREILDADMVIRGSTAPSR